MSFANLLGSCGPWADARSRDGGFPLSYTDSCWNSADLESWRLEARRKLTELTALDAMLPLRPAGSGLDLQVSAAVRAEGTEVQKFSWTLPFGPRVEAWYVRPDSVPAEFPLPGILAFHDHGGFKYFGKEKIADDGVFGHPLIDELRARYYGGRAWANALAREGFGVLVPDGFLFGSRRADPAELPGWALRRIVCSGAAAHAGSEGQRFSVRVEGEPFREGQRCAEVPERRELVPEDVGKPFDPTPWQPGPEGQSGSIAAYNAFAAAYEEVAAKSLFAAGLTLPALFMFEDIRALDVLASLPGIDAANIGCCGLSGGGLRSVLLAAVDERIRCSVTAGFMTTWRDLALYRSFTHTWMAFIPLLGSLMDFPDILGLHAPSPAMVLTCQDDPLFDPAETRLALDKLEAIWTKAGSPTALSVATFPGPHRFDREMQRNAFRWLSALLAASVPRPHPGSPPLSPGCSPAPGL